MGAISMKITGLGISVPDEVMTNEALVEKLRAIGVETSDQWIRTRTGIRERRIAPKGTGTSTYGAKAALEALEVAGRRPEDVQLIIGATETPDMAFPAMACVVQEKIEAWNATCPDLHAGCAGTGVALMTAHAFLTSGQFKNCLILGADLLSTFVNWLDRATCVLLADAGGALYVEPTEEPLFYSAVSGSDGRLGKLISLPAGGSLLPIDSPEIIERHLHKLQMDGREVFRLVVKLIRERVVPEGLTKAKLTIPDIGLWFFHQANARINDAIVEYLGIEPERVVTNLDRFGNTSNASIILCLYEAWMSGKLLPGMKIALVFFGAGLTWGMVILEWTLPPPNTVGTPGGGEERG